MKWTVAFAACLAFVSAQNATLPYSSQNTTAPAGTTAAAAKTTASPPTAASKEATVNSYNVTVPGTNHTCIMVEAAMQVKVVYATKDGQVKEAVLPLDNATVVDPVRSSCTSSSGEQTLVLLFGHNNILSLVFAKNGTVYLHKLFVEVFFSTEFFPGAVKPDSMVGNSFKNCFISYSLDGTEDDALWEAARHKLSSSEDSGASSDE
ncbi:hypothetical protein HPB51_021701 [Rhipicephalus microplus]|uniref:Lysosome-associated membrane glycoprotein 5 n=1 Tax=Rhipicephalus microplus TaxID=6941 RepID=A0A9J6D7Z3_RHIMP|nr:hypothetical protein HPB51_021701 [Rhipicephalus microplus]